MHDALVSRAGITAGGFQIANQRIWGDALAERSPDRETDFLRDRAATLRAMAAEMPPSVARQLLDIAAQLEVRAAKLEGSDTYEGGEGV
jgi:hypothetical protein